MRFSEPTGTLAGAMLMFSALPAAAADTAGSVAVIGFARGEVAVDGRPAGDGDALKVGSTIRTGDGKCALIFKTDRIVHLDSDTELRITEAVADGGDTVDLAIGRLRALVRNGGENRKAKFYIRTKTAVMGVRGTHVYVDGKDPGSPRFLTAEGEAEVKLPGAGPGVTLRENQLLVATAGREISSLTPTTLDASRTRELTLQVAPPPDKARTQSELAQVEAKVEISSAGGESPIPAMTKLPLPPLDPVVDAGGGAIPVTVKFGR